MADIKAIQDAVIDIEYEMNKAADASNDVEIELGMVERYLDRTEYEIGDAEAQLEKAKVILGVLETEELESEKIFQEQAKVHKEFYDKLYKQKDYLYEIKRKIEKP